jgi:hypothetical protein
MLGAKGLGGECCLEVRHSNSRCEIHLSDLHSKRIGDTPKIFFYLLSKQIVVNLDSRILESHWNVLYHSPDRLGLFHCSIDPHSAVPVKFQLLIRLHMHIRNRYNGHLIPGWDTLNDANPIPQLPDAHCNRNQICDTIYGIVHIRATNILLNKDMTTIQTQNRSCKG